MYHFYITDAIACRNVFDLFEADVIPVGLVIFYLMTVVCGGITNFVNMSCRMQDLIELCKEYGIITQKMLDDRVKYKKNKLEKWSNLIK